MRPGGMFDIYEFGKRIRRLLDGNYSYRKILVLLVIFGAILLYLGPPIAQWIFSSNGKPIEAFEDHCMNERLGSFYFDIKDYNANVLHDPPKETEHQYLPYIGNGIIGVPILPEAWLYIKHKRTLSLPVYWQPLITATLPESSSYREATVTHYTSGIVHKYQCLRDGYYIVSQYFAHRSFDGILVQDVKVVNPSALSQEVTLRSQTSAHWPDTQIEPVKILVDGTFFEFNLISGHVQLPDTNKIIAVSIVYKAPPKVLQVKARGSSSFEYLTSIKYSEAVSPEQYHVERDVTQKMAIDTMKKALIRQQRGLKSEHINHWQSYWYTGFRISESKATEAINGHKINSTMYYVLSHVARGVLDVEKVVSNSEGCYKGHHTLNAPKLWKDTSSIDLVNDVVHTWLITLEKQGCHRLITGSPSAVQQAIVLSLGGLRFSNQHLEFNIDPKYLHRDYLFRRISYGNITHLNISVSVNEDNRAVLGVALDRSDSGYYACDAGCLDDPVPLSPTYTNFPVKLTQPFTSILYITSDYQHMLDLRKTLHVHTIDEAPAHDHHVMALHKHGHQLGGLPTFFWVTIGFLIVVFHLFLCKLMITEYRGHQDRQKVRYNKP